RATVAGLAGTYLVGVSTSTTILVGSWQFRPEMRAAPIFGRSSGSDFQLESASTTDLRLSGGAGATTKTVDLVGVVSAGLTTGNAYRVKDNNSGNSWFDFIAEL